MSAWRKLGPAGAGMSYLGAIALFIMMMVTVIDVLGRYVFNSPLLGAYELTEFLVLILIFSFLAFTQSEGGHVSVDFLVNRLPRRLRTIIELANHLVCLGLMALIAWMSLLKALDLKRVGETSLNLAIPDYPFVLFLVLGCLVMCLEYIRNLIRLFSDLKKGGAS